MLVGDNDGAIKRQTWIPVDNGASEQSFRQKETFSALTTAREMASRRRESCEWQIGNFLEAEWRFLF